MLPVESEIDAVESEIDAIRFRQLGRTITNTINEEIAEQLGGNTTDPTTPTSSALPAGEEAAPEKWIWAAVGGMVSLGAAMAYFKKR